MRRATRIAIYVLTGFAACLIALAIAFFVLTRTSYGMEQVRGYAVKWLSSQINGQLEIGRITSSALWGELTVHDLVIKDPRGQPFVQLDSATLQYNLRTLLGGQIVASSVKVYHPRLLFQRLPNDSLWNYDYIFVDRTPETKGKSKRVEFHNALVYNAFVTLEQPLQTKGKIEVKDTARSLVRKVDGGLLRVYRFEDIDADLSRVIWDSPNESGRLFDARKLSGVAYIWKEPVRIRELQGQVITRDSLIGFNIPRVEFGSSTASAVGEVIKEKGRSDRYDVKIDGRSLSFADLQWLYPELPKEGKARLELRIETQPKGTLWYASDAHIEAPGTKIDGNFGIVTGDTMYFTAVDLKASPLDLELLDKVLPGELPVEGLMVGTVEVKGPISRLDVKGDVRITPSDATSPTSVKWQGLFDARRELTASNFTADVKNFDLAMLRAFRPSLNFKGVVNGRVEAEGTFASMRFAADLQHELAGLSSRFAGGGSYDATSRQLDVRMNALPISFDELSNAYPALRKVRGEARGPIVLSGPTDNLSVEARLATLGGELDFKGALQLRDGRRRYSGVGRFSDFQLDRLLYDLPATNISGNIRFDLTGTSTADASGTVAAQLEDARIMGVGLKDVKLDARLHDGLFGIDSLRANSLLGPFTANGDFGIAQDRAGTVRFAVQNDSIVPWPDRALETGGRLDGHGTVRGGLAGFDLSAEATIERALLARANAQHAALRVNGQWLGTDSGSVHVALSADTADFYGELLDSLRTELTYGRDGGRLLLQAAGRERSYQGHGDVRMDSAGITLYIREAAGGLIGAPWVLAAPFGIQVAATTVRADSFAFRQARGGGSAMGAGHLAWGSSRSDSLDAALQPIDFNLALRRAPLSDYLRFYRRGSSGEGSIDANVALTGTAGQPIVNADASLTDLRYGDTRFERLGASFDYADQFSTARVVGQQDGRTVLVGEGRIPVDLAFLPRAERKLARPLDFSFNADSMPASVITGFVSGFRNVAGSISGNIDLQGTTIDPTIAGLLTLSGGAATYAATGVRYRDVTGTFRVLNDSVVALEANARAGNGSAALQGRMTFAPLTNPSFDSLIINASAFQAAARRDAQFTTSGRFVLRGEFRAPVLTGNITVDRGELNLDEIYRRTQIVELDPNSPLYFAVVDTSLVAVKKVLPASMSPFVRNLMVERLSVDVARETWLRSRNLNVEVTGLLQVTLDRSDANAPRSVEDIRLSGELTAVRGTYQLEFAPFTRQFDIREGNVQFPGTPGLDPNLAFTALYRARPLQGEPIDILAEVNGTLLSPRIRLTSEDDPRKSESDLASILFFGVQTGALSLSQSRTLDAFNGRFGGVGTLGVNLLTSSSLGYLAAGLQTLAQDHDLLDYVSLRSLDAPAGESARSAGLGFSAFSSQLELGRYIGRNLFAIYSNRLAAGPVAIGGVRLEWRFHPTFTLETFWEDRFARSRGLGIENTAAFRKVYGFFLFREWAY